MAGPETTSRSRAGRLRLAALVGGVALGALRVTDVQAACFAVTRTDDTERGTCSLGDCSLREAIEAANALVSEGSAVILPAGTYVLSVAKRLSMTEQITIKGAGSATTIIDGSHLIGVFDTAGADEIDGVTVRNGMDTSGVGGGGIHNGGTLTATDLVLQRNGTNGQGGGLFNEGTAYLTQSVLQSNTAATGGGFANDGSISFLGSFTIDGNMSTAEGGGVSNDGVASLDNTNPPVPPGPPTGGGTISSNTSGTSGGGIHNTGLITLMNVALDGNGATADGGALWSNGSLDLANGTISNSAAGGNGAGMWNDGATTLTNVTLAANSTAAGMGGAVWTDGSAVLDSSTLAGNGASAGGGTFKSGLGTVELRNTILAANTPANCSGGIMSDGHNIDSGSSCTPTAAGDLPNTDPLLGPLQYNPPAPAFLETRLLLPGSPALDAAGGCPPPDTDERSVTRPQGPSCDIGAVEVGPLTATTTTTTTTLAPQASCGNTTTTTTTTLASREACNNCVDDDGDGRTDYEDPACCTQTAAMQVKKLLIVPGPAGAMKGHLSLAAILAQAGFVDVDPTRDDVTVQFRNQNGELLCANISHQRWKRGKRRGPFIFGDSTGALAQGLRKMQIKAEKSGSVRFTAAGKKMDLDRYARPELTATVRVGDRCSTATIALRSRKNKKFVFP